MGINIIKSYAKINLCLNVKGVLPNGYHDLKMIMLPIKLHDTILLSELKNHNDHFITMDDFSALNSHDNTVFKALELLCEKTKSNTKYRVDIHKAIPTMSGMGGGSSNAAFVLKAANSFSKFNLDTETIFDISSKIGSDVPFFVECKPALCEGTGSLITQIDIKNKYYVLIVKPYEGCKTKMVFDGTGICDDKTENIEKLIDALKNGKDEIIAEYVFNDLEESAIKLVPEISTIKAIMKDCGITIVSMTGSGSSVFGMSTSKKQIKECAKVFEKKDKYKVILTEVLK